MRLDRNADREMSSGWVSRTGWGGKEAYKTEYRLNEALDSIWAQECEFRSKWVPRRSLGRGSEHATPKYAILTKGLFWVEDN